MDIVKLSTVKQSEIACSIMRLHTTDLPWSFLSGSGSACSKAETVDARSATADTDVGRSLDLTAACTEAWLRERALFLCRLLDMSFFMTASMSATSQGGFRNTTYTLSQVS